MSFAGLRELTAATVPLAAIAAAMVGLNLYILRRLVAASKVPSLSTFVLGKAVLVSQAVFWAGLAYYLEVPTVDGFVIFSLAVQFMMVPVGVWFVTLVFEEGERPLNWRVRGWPIGLALLLLVNEMGMSWAFAALVTGTLPTDLASLAAIGQALLAASSTAWYYWPMGVSMIVLVRWAGLAPEDRVVLYALSATAIVAPWAFEVPVVGASAMAGVMGLAFALLWRGFSALPLGGGSLRLRVGAAIALLVMSGTWAISYVLLPPAWALAPFAAVMVAVMTVELAYLLRTLLWREGSHEGQPTLLPAGPPAYDGRPASRERVEGPGAVTDP